MGSLIAASQSRSIANSANNQMNTAGAYALLNNNAAQGAFNNFQTGLWGQYAAQQPAIDALAGPTVNSFHLGALPGVATSPLGDQSKPNTARSWLGGY